MKHLTLNVECWIDMEIIEYISQLDGVDKIEVNEDKDTIDVYYNDKLMPLKILMMEIELFLKKEKLPFVIGFDKHSENELSERIVVVDDICCEYCVMGNIGDLLLTNGIDKVTTNYDFKEYRDVRFEIKYDKNLISEDDVNKWKFV